MVDDSFPQAAGRNQFPNGNWVPELFSLEAQIAFRRKSVIQDITNTDYTGEISAFGDTVRIIKEPDISITPYTRGKEIIPQALDDDEIVLKVDKSNSFAFAVDDIEKMQSHINWAPMAQDRGGYGLADAMDREVLAYMFSQVGVSDGEVDLSNMLIGSASTPQEVSYSGMGTALTPLNLLSRFARLLDERNAPMENRWFVADPYFYELLQQEESKVLSADYTDKGILRNGMVHTGLLRNFRLYQTNNFVPGGTGPSTTGSNNYGIVMAGHMSATATVEQLLQVETARTERGFSDLVKGLHVYGRKVLRPEALTGAFYNAGA